jgi:hypothetical protein
VTSVVYKDFKDCQLRGGICGKEQPVEGSDRVVLGLCGKDSRKASKQCSDLCAGDGEVTDAFSERVCHCASYMECGVVSIDKIRGVNA